MTTGDAVSTEARPLGSELVAPAPVNSTTLTVDFAADFNEDGGSLVLNGVTLAYTACDHDAETITLAAPLAVAAATDDFVAQVEDGKPGVEWTTNVSVDEGDPIPVNVPTALAGYFPEGETDDTATVQMSSTAAGYSAVARPQVDSLFDGGAVWNPILKLNMASTVVPDSVWTPVSSWTLNKSNGGINLTGAAGKIIYDGQYEALTRLSFPPNANGRRGVRITQNGISVESQLQGAEPSGVTYVGVFELLDAVTDDLVTIELFQSSGASMTVANGQLSVFRTSSS